MNIILFCGLDSPKNCYDILEIGVKDGGKEMITLKTRWVGKPRNQWAEHDIEDHNYKLSILTNFLELHIEVSYLF